MPPANDPDIEIRCPFCREHLVIRESHLEADVECHRCRRSFCIAEMNRAKAKKAAEDRARREREQAKKAAELRAKREARREAEREAQAEQDARLRGWREDEEHDRRPCPECAEMIKVRAQVCRFCGRGKKAAPARRSTGLQLGGGFGCGGLLLLCLVFAAVSKMREEPPRPPTPAEQEQALQRTAYRMAQQFVEQRLKSPSTAKFPWEPLIYKRDRELFGVAGYVDSQNSFGATVRTKWALTMERRGDNWTLLDFAFEE